MAIPNKNVGENGAWAYPGAVQIFWVPLLSRERVKLRISNLASTFTEPIRIKANKKIGEKGAWAYPGATHFLSTSYYLRNG